MSLEADITRKCEKAFAALLQAAVPDLRFLLGGGEDGDPADLSEDERQAMLEPPYAVFAAIQPDELITGSGVYQMQGRLVLLTDIDATHPEQHSAWLAELKAALDAILRPVTMDDLNFRLNGFDILGPWEKVEDDAGQCRCHALPLAIGAAG